MKKIWSLIQTKPRLILILVLVLAVGFGVWKWQNQSSAQPQYQTATAQKGTLIENVTASGQVTSANNVAITIQASGVIEDVLVKNGDAVTQSQIIAHLTLDQASQQKQAAAWASYLSAQNSLASARAKMNSLQSTLFKANQTFVNDTGIPNPSDADKTNPKYVEENADWLQAEADYKNQANVITAAQASLSSASLSLSQTSSTITAPVAGVVKGLTITPGAIITLSSSNSTTTTSQVLGSINQLGPTLAQVNISEIDSVNVSEDQKATLTLDAFTGKTFTGKVISINTNGVVSSGVTTYPAIIAFDTSNDHIYPNMAVSAKIITKIKDAVILVPSVAVQTRNGQATVRIMQNGNPVSVDVEAGDANDTQTEIISGINEGDQVVTTVTAVRQTTSGQTGSVFGGGGGGGFGGLRGVGGGGGGR